MNILAEGCRLSGVSYGGYAKIGIIFDMPTTKPPLFSL